MDRCARAPRPGSSEHAERRARPPPPPRVPRVNGWSPPLHSFQVVSWVVFLVLGAAVFLVFIPLLPHVGKLIAYSVIGVCCVLVLVTYLAAVSVDPAEANVRHKDNPRQAPVPFFDRSKQPLVIDRQFCCLCQVTVGPETKHCITCNKCVAGFDHHCPWLNTCVGSRNYWFFLGFVTSALAGILCVITILTCVLTQFFVNPTWLRTDPGFSAVTSAQTWLLFLPFAAVKTKAWVLLTVGVTVALLAVSGLVLLSPLFIFHLYLIANGLSTLEYNRRSEKPQGATDQPPVKNRPSRAGLPQELKDHSGPGAPRRETSVLIPSEPLPDVDGVNIPVYPGNDRPEETKMRILSHLPAGVMAPMSSRTVPSEPLPDVEYVSIPLYPGDPPPTIPKKKPTSSAPCTTASDDTSPTGLSSTDSVSTHPEDSAPAGSLSLSLP